MTWQWAAAVYTQFGTNYNMLGVKPVDDNSRSQYKNFDPAGTPENFKQFVIAGARGDGTTLVGNYTAPTVPSPCLLKSTSLKGSAPSSNTTKKNLLDDMLDIFSKALGK